MKSAKESPTANYVRRLASRLARRRFTAPADIPATGLGALDYDGYRHIRFAGARNPHVCAPRAPIYRSFTLTSLAVTDVTQLRLGTYMFNAVAPNVRKARGRIGSIPSKQTARNSKPRIRVGIIFEAPLEAFRPTQMAVGMRSVTRKLQKIEKRADKPEKIEKTLFNRPIPAVYGPGGGLFMVDHHHFGMALCLADLETAYVRVIADASDLSRAAFWKRMETDGRLYLYDEHGKRVSPSRLPTSLSGLRHDPFRDLAWDVREADGFRKVTRPYAEFEWANFFRAHIPLASLRRDPKSALREALKLCRSRAAAHLPGFAH